jgi:hypothetical protein
MTIYYSNLYDTTINQGVTLYTPRTPNVITRGVPFTTMGSFTIATGVVLTAGDTIRLLPAVPKGFKITRFVATSPGYESSTGALTANLGWASQALGVGIVTGYNTTFLRSGNTTAVTDAQVLAQTAAGGSVTATTNLQAIGESDTLLFYVSVTATAAGTNGATPFLIEGILPGN